MPAFMPNWIDNFFRDDDFFANNWQRELSIPAVNVKETDAAFELEVAAPGMKKDDFKIEIKDGNLVISAETKEEKEEKGKNFTRREFNFSSFNRSFWLPENVKPGEVKATYKEGILYLSLPKIKVEKKEPAKLIEVK
jgi:HSP20 family protein